MYISNIKIKNFRNFRDISIEFRDGINILIGQNNAGKSNVLKALALIFGNRVKKQLVINDIYNGLSLEELKSEPPKISISVSLSQSSNEDLMEGDLVFIRDWLVLLKEPYLAQIHYEFFLPEEYESKYLEYIKNVQNIQEARNIIDDYFIRLYINKIWVGKLDNKILGDKETINKFDFQFLDAIRDVERDMFSGKNTLLKNVIDFFIDYEFKSDKNYSKEEQNKNIEENKKKSKEKFNDLVENLKNRLKEGENKILSYVNDVGATFDDYILSFDGNITDNELYSILKLVIIQNLGKDFEVNIPVSNNGLGYNNLIFMSLLLAKMQVDSDGEYLGSNAKVFPILAIEEPEAHLHPTMQFKFIKFLNKNLKDKKVRQSFITSHSTHITSSAKLDDIICLYKEGNETKVAYPGNVFWDLKNGKKEENYGSKQYVQRFLDATKSNMLFSEKIIFVEGIAEQLLVSIFAKYLDKSLEDKHISVINVGGNCFDHFLYLFKDDNEGFINCKIACITDLDPCRKDKGEKSYKQCYPFEFNNNRDKYDYTNSKNKFYDNYKNYKNICFFTQDEYFGKTLEYQLIFDNPTCEFLLKVPLSNQQIIQELINKFKENAELDDMLNIIKDNNRKNKKNDQENESKNENDRIIESLSNVKDENIWSEDNKKRALIASKYLNSIKTKGAVASELSYMLHENLELKNTANYVEFKVPEYIENAINWICEDN